MENHVISLQQEILKDKQWNEDHIIILIKKKEREKEHHRKYVCMKKQQMKCTWSASFQFFH